MSFFVSSLLLNAMLSFTGASLLVRAALRLFRIPPGRIQLALLALPWLKLALDAARGMPAGSFFWQRIHGVRQDLGQFQVGFGVNHWGPLVQLRLSAKLGSRIFPQSAGDLLVGALARRGAWLPGALLGLVLLVSSALAARRLLGWFRHARAQRHAPLSLLSVEHGVPVLLDATHDGAPYASGVLAPRVVFSAEHYARLSPAERDACLLHELSHVAHHDTLWSPLLALLTDVFWFLPGARWVLRRVQCVMELRADEAAVRRGASPHALAAALVSTGELLQSRAAAGVGLVRPRLLLQRVQRLLEPGAVPPPRAGFQHWASRLLLLALVISCVLQAVFFGTQG
ncbi:MAG TPA: M56 family metallopeptidase [Polyangiaceae bacterium]|nr:M56 family metallopeptidase [Polyangiaceae bacterium]